MACQLVCNARGLLLSAETNWPGGLQDIEILERSAVYKHYQNTEEGWLLGEMWILSVTFFICVEVCGFNVFLFSRRWSLSFKEVVDDPGGLPRIPCGISI